VSRRWQEDPDAVYGPVETAIRAELEGLGWNPLTPPGALRSAAERACALAETYDDTQNAGYLPALDRQLARVMDDARRATQPDDSGLRDGTEEEVADFERERRRRRPPAEGGA
jgi:hypothetical protein